MHDWCVGGFAPFSSLATRETFLDISDNVAMAPGPGYYDPKPPRGRNAVTGTGTMTSRVSRAVHSQPILTPSISLPLKTKRFPPPSFITPGPGAYNVTQPIGNPVTVMPQPLNIEVTNTLTNILPFH